MRLLNGSTKICLGTLSNEFYLISIQKWILFGYKGSSIGQSGSSSKITPSLILLFSYCFYISSLI
jgi:hypothetical protein